MALHLHVTRAHKRSPSLVTGSPNRLQQTVPDVEKGVSAQTRTRKMFTASSRPRRLCHGLRLKKRTRQAHAKARVALSIRVSRATQNARQRVVKSRVCGLKALKVISFWIARMPRNRIDRQAIPCRPRFQRGQPPSVSRLQGAPRTGLVRGRLERCFPRGIL